MVKIAIFGFNVKTISRLRGESIAKTAAYILRENVFDSYQKKVHYYAQSKDILFSEIIIPENAPREFLNLRTLLEEAERAERRYDARVGRVIRLTLPNDTEISDDERINLVKGFVKDTFVSQNMCAVLAIHEGKNENPSKNNPHAHVVLTDRPVDINGFCARKNRDWNKTEQICKWRKIWAETQNKFFEEKGLEVRVSHESLETQGIDREPTIPLGREATALERKGICTEAGNQNREIEARRIAQEKEKSLHKRKMEHKRDKGWSR